METSKVWGGHELTKVTTEEFYAALYADPRDIMPFVEPGPYPYVSKWATNNNARVLFGLSESIANCTESRYFLVTTPK